jgi:hypothetical protein
MIARRNLLALPAALGVPPNDDAREAPSHGTFITSTYAYDHTGERVSLTEGWVTTIFRNKFPRSAFFLKV